MFHPFPQGRKKEKKTNSYGKLIFSGKIYIESIEQRQRYFLHNQPNFLPEFNTFREYLYRFERKPYNTVDEMFGKIQQCGGSCARNPPKFSRVSTRINIYENPPVYYVTCQFVLRRCSVNVNKSTASKTVNILSHLLKRNRASTEMVDFVEVSCLQGFGSASL